MSSAGTSSVRSAWPPELVSLGILVSILVPGVKWVAFAIGAGLAFAALTNTCAMGMLLARLPYNRGAMCDVRAVVAQLVDAPPGRAKAS